MLRGGLGDILLAVLIQLGALTAIAAGYAGFLLRPTGSLLRLLLAGAGLAAAFWHGIPDAARLGLALGVPAAIAGVQLSSSRGR